jgi:hypothetical protein
MCSAEEPPGVQIVECGQASRETGETLPSPVAVELPPEDGRRISRKAQSVSARWESEEVVVPSMAAQDNTAGGKGLLDSQTRLHGQC